MREILFRAKAINRDKGYHRTNYKNGDWVYGLVTRLYDNRFENLPAEMKDLSGVNGIEVDHETIGQYTGLTDKNGTKIFEGDILHFKTENGWSFPCPIGTNCYSRILFGRCNPQKNSTSEYIGFWNLSSFFENDELWDYGDSIENTLDKGGCVAGNIYDNPELLEEG